MDTSPFLPLPEGMVIGQVDISAAQLTVEVISTQPCVPCPGCGSLSDQIHCQYQRTVHDVPCGGRKVLLRLRVRKFVCRSSSCPRKVFAERLPEVVQPWGRVSNRLLEELKAVGLASSAEVSERLAPRLGMQVKASSLLRYLRTIPPPADVPVRVLGIDDFALRRGDRYGTILVNIETSKPLDLLPDRTAEAVLPWLKRHQEIEVVSRDRASAYADAVTRALPHALQVADRYHLVQNLHDHLQRFLDHKRTCLPIVEEILLKVGLTSDPSSAASLADQAEASALLPSAERIQADGADQQMSGIEPARQGTRSEQEVALSSLTYAERKKKISRDKRLARYELVMALYRAGMGQRAIARELQMSRHIVQRFITAPAFPERAPGSGLRPKGQSKVAPYLGYLRERWEAGMHNGAHLFGEIKERGYTGSASGLRRLLGAWRTALPPKARQGPPRKPRLASQSKQPRLSSRSAAFLMILPPEQLTERQQHQLAQMTQHEELYRAYHLAQEFIGLLKERQAALLADWLKRAAESQVRELKSFAHGIRRDYAAVQAACRLPWNNGIVEGHVNRLKFLKRQMFGRAHLDLLCVKVLHAV